jgi:hypothetical protein
VVAVLKDRASLETASASPHSSGHKNYTNSGGRDSWGALSGSS